MKRRAAAATRFEVAVATRAEADPIAGCLMRPGGGMDGWGWKWRSFGGKSYGQALKQGKTRASKANAKRRWAKPYTFFFFSERRGNVRGSFFLFRERKRAGFYSLFFIYIRSISHRLSRSF
jgi:hypothetical protein